MSVRTMARVWAESRHSGTHLLMLLAIADFADDDGNAYPAVPTLAAKCRMKARNANVILAALRASGELQVRQNEGPRGTNRYQIVFDCPGVQKLAGVQKHAGMQSLACTPAKACPNPLQPNADEPSLNHQEPKKKRERQPLPVAASSLLADIEPHVVADWEQVRKAKRVGPVTETVVKLLRAEAAKAGKTVQQALEICCMRGWASFNAEWAGASSTAKPAVLAADDVFTGKS